VWRNEKENHVGVGGKRVRGGKCTTPSQIWPGGGKKVGENSTKTRNVGRGVDRTGPLLIFMKAGGGETGKIFIGTTRGRDLDPGQKKRGTESAKKPPKTEGGFCSGHSLIGLGVGWGVPKNPHTPLRKKKHR